MTHRPDHTQHHQARPRKAVHKDWRTWTVVVLMLVAMATYILTMDESEVPEVQPPPAVENADAG
jgi:hypothetical protein